MRSPRPASTTGSDADVPPLLTSFQPPSLEAARASAPGLPRGLLVNELWQGWLETAQRLDCVAVVLKHTLVDAALVGRAHAARLRVGVYTPNDAPDVERVRAAGVDMVVTDAVDVYAARTWIAIILRPVGFAAWAGSHGAGATGAGLRPAGPPRCARACAGEHARRLRARASSRRRHPRTRHRIRPTASRWSCTTSR